MTHLEAQLAGAHRAHVEWLAHFDACPICPELNAGQCEEATSLEDRATRLRREALAAFDAQKAKWESCGVCHGEGRVWLAGWEVCPCQLPAEVGP